MNFKKSRVLLFAIFLSPVSYAFAGETSTAVDDAVKEDMSENDMLAGNFEAGQEKYAKSCINCHGAAGKGVASYPKISGQEVSYTKLKLETYRAGTKIGPNSSLMIMMARPLTDEDIANLAVYLKDAES